MWRIADRHCAGQHRAGQHTQTGTAQHAHIKVALPVNYYGEGYFFIQ